MLISAFPARWDGNSGHIIIEAANDHLPTPQVAFVPLSGTDAKFIKPIDDIVEIKKVCRILQALAPTVSGIGQPDLFAASKPPAHRWDQVLFPCFV